MESLNSYLGLAFSDKCYAEDGMRTGERLGHYNGVASIAAQSAEKYLKAVLLECFTGDKEAIALLHTHNLRAIYNKIVTKYSLTITTRDCKWLGDFYFDARYPGDDFVIVNKTDAEECLALLERIKLDVEAILQQESTEREKLKLELQKIKAF